jgi:Thiol-disulfide isomerase and thioredoxins
LESYKDSVELQKEDVNGEFHKYTMKKVSPSPDKIFETELKIKQAEFWTVGNVRVYLIPGENLEVSYNDKSKTYNFKGKSKEECEFLNEHGMHIYGDLSFLDNGKNVRKSFEETKLVIDSIAKQRLELLKNTKGLDEYFVRVQKMRIKAHQLNSYLNYYMFSDNYESCSMGDEYETESGRNFIESKRDLLEPMVQDLVNSEFIDDFDIRWVVDRCKSDHLTNFPTKSIWKEFYTVKDLLKRFDDSSSPELIIEARETLTTLTCKDFIEILTSEIEKLSALEMGKPAIDFVINDIGGKETTLSTYKGKLIYIDFWASWCGPCKREFPHFVELKKKYKNVAFLSVSIDERREAWLKFMEHKQESDVLQYHASREKALNELIAWRISLIPRFILIDKNFNIIDAYAPRPSDKEIEDLLSKYM